MHVHPLSLFFVFLQTNCHKQAQETKTSLQYKYKQYWSAEAMFLFLTHAILSRLRFCLLPVWNDLDLFRFRLCWRMIRAVFDNGYKTWSKSGVKCSGYGMWALLMAFDRNSSLPDIFPLWKILLVFLPILRPNFCKFFSHFFCIFCQHVTYFVQNERFSQAEVKKIPLLQKLHIPRELQKYFTCNAICVFFCVFSCIHLLRCFCVFLCVGFFLKVHGASFLPKVNFFVIDVVLFFPGAPTEILFF